MWMGSVGLEMYGGGDVMLFVDGVDVKVFKGMIDNMKVFGFVCLVFGF